MIVLIILGSLIYLWGKSEGYEKRGFELEEEQLESGREASRLSSWERDLFEREDNLQSNVLAQKLGLHPFVVKKSLPLIKRYTLKELELIYNQLLNLDIKTKTGQGDQRMLIDLFVGKVSLSTP